MKHQLNKMLEKGILIPSKSEICLPAFLVGKKDGSKKLVVDYISVNKNSFVDHYPLPSFESIINRLQKRKFYTKLDLSNGYFHVILEPKQ